MPQTDPRTRALGCAVVLGVVLLFPLVCALLFWGVSVAAQNYWAMVTAINGAF